MNNMVNSELNVSEFSPKQVGDKLFSIPLYQRLYAWESEQVMQLLQDLYDTFCRSKGNQEYFVGSVVTSHIERETNRYALIDGQQRMTTFWLLGFVLKDYDNCWADFILSENRLRLDFIARDDDRHFLQNLSKTSLADFRERNSISSGVNSMMVNTINVVYKYFQKVPDRQGFAKYIYSKTKFVLLTLPDSIDLNKYFEIMNNRGVQLEKHEILKARLLSKIWDENKEIEDAKREKYAIIWDACAQMNRDIEKSFEKVEQDFEARKEIRSLLVNDFHTIDSFLAQIPLWKNREEITFDCILHDAQNLTSSESSTKHPTDAYDNFSPIVSFPTFLLHVYKLYKNSREVSLKDKDLLQTIVVEGIGDVKETSLFIERFIRDLLLYRILFDQYIIRSYKTGSNNLWETRILPIDDEGFERKKAFERSSQIMAMLNVSTSTEYWLTPLMKYLRETTQIQDNSYVVWLENLDNCFAYTRTVSDLKMMNTSNNLLSNIYGYRPEGKIDFSTINLSNGVNTEHYWFFKLDYCLWKIWNENSNKKKWEKEIRSFQFRSNRSVEHVYPQHPEDNTEWGKEDLNNFGNLALISVRSNSGYNNQLPYKKKYDFQKRILDWGIESLKLFDIYSRDEWNQKECKEHYEEMLNVLKVYHSNTDNE